MTDVLPDTHKVHGMVIFTAVLNFISVFFMAILAVFSVVALIFGNSFGLYQTVTTKMQELYPTTNYTLGLNLVFGLLLFAALAFGALALAVGVGLLKGKKFAWYVQVAASVLGLFGFPFGTVLNGVILVFFFQQPIRTYFKV